VPVIDGGAVVVAALALLTAGGASTALVAAGAPWHALPVRPGQNVLSAVVDAAEDAGDTALVVRVDPILSPKIKEQ
jgi:hypothetical protein